MKKESNNFLESVPIDFRLIEEQRKAINIKLKEAKPALNLLKDLDEDAYRQIQELKSEMKEMYENLRLYYSNKNIKRNITLINNYFIKQRKTKKMDFFKQTDYYLNAKSTPSEEEALETLDFNKSFYEGELEENPVLLATNIQSKYFDRLNNAIARIYDKQSPSTAELEKMREKLGEELYEFWTIKFSEAFKAVRKDYKDRSVTKSFEKLMNLEDDMKAMGTTMLDMVNYANSMIRLMNGVWRGYDLAIDALIEERDTLQVDITKLEEEKDDADEAKKEAIANQKEEEDRFKDMEDLTKQEEKRQLKLISMNEKIAEGLKKKQAEANVDDEEESIDDEPETKVKKNGRGNKE